MLKDKVAIITGSSRGIGNGIAKMYLENGAVVVVCGSRKENAEKAVAEFVNQGFDSEKMLAVGMSMTDIDSIKSAVKEVIERFGRIDVLVNNAGITSNVSLLDSTDSEFQEMFDINVFGVVKLTREVVKYMKESGGAIINTSSMVGINGGRNQSAYSASKFAVNGLTKSWAKELGQYKIRVNAVSPGVVETDMMKDAVNEQIKQMMINMTPLRMIGKPDDLAGAYLYLASDMAKFTTGTIIQVDGGLVM